MNALMDYTMWVMNALMDCTITEHPKAETDHEIKLQACMLCACEKVAMSLYWVVHCQGGWQ